MMDSERWKQIDEIFHQALEYEPPARDAYLTEACKEDESLRAEIEALIESHHKDSTFFDTPASDIAAEYLAQKDNTGALGHYKIVKKIGSGGMGEVYLAEDTRLNRKVALKLLPPEFTNDKGRIRRFEKEARAVSALNHPNILTIYDIGQIGNSSFIASEYVDGETLRQRVRNSKMPLKEILTVCIQAAEALNAAHQAGVIHRDIKPENIMIRKDGYVKVLDFGLAKSIDRGALQNSQLNTQSSDATETGILVGTVRYMSPEQARGLKVDAQTDIFSLGVVFYELITGSFPFAGPTSIDTLAAILQKDPQPLNSFGAFPDELQSIISKALEKVAEKRYQTVGEMLGDLRRLKMRIDLDEELKRSTTSASFTHKKTSTILKNVLLSASLLLVAIIAFYFIRPHTGTPPPQKAQSFGQNPRPSIAVIGFKNLSGTKDAAWISTALAEMLSTELAQGEKLLVISGEEVTRSKRELSLDFADSFSNETLAKVRKNLPADYVVLGAYYVSPDQNQIRLDLNVQKTSDGKIAARFTETRNELDLLGLILAAGSSLRQSLGIVPLNQQQINSARSTLSSNSDAIRFYSEGISRLRELDRRGARDLFLTAVKADPKFSLAYSALSQSWFELGYMKNARDAAKTARDLSDSLSREEKLLVEGRYDQANYDSEAAIRCYQSLLTFFPDNLEYGLLLVDAQSNAGFMTDASQTIKLLRNLPSPFNDDPRIDLADSQVYEVYDIERILKLAQTAAEKARLRGSDLLEAKALTSQGLAQGALTQKSAGIAALQRAKEIYKSHGAKNDLMLVDEYLSSTLLNFGDFQSALKLNDQALQNYQQADEQRNLAITYNSRAQIESWAGKADESIKSLQTAQRIFASIGDQESLGSTLGRIASFYSRTGDLKKSEQNYKAAIDLLKSTKSLPYLEGNLTALAQIKNQTSNKDEARKLYMQAMEIGRTLKSRKGIADGLVNLALLNNREDEIRTAIQYNDGLLNDFKKEKNIEGQFYVFENLESLYEANNDTANIIRVVHEKLPVIRTFRNPQRWASELQSCGFALADRGFLKEAETLGNEVINAKQPMFKLGQYLLFNVYWAQANMTQLKKVLSDFQRDQSGVTWSGTTYAIKLEGSMDFESGNLSDGEKRFNEVIQRSTSGKEFDWIFWGTLNLANLYTARADYPRAEQLFEQARQKAKQESSEKLMISYHTELGEYYFSRERFKEAQKEWTMAADYYEKEKSMEEKLTAQARIANCLILQGDLDKASQLLKSINETDPLIRESFWDLADIRSAKARLLAAQKKYNQAVPLLNEIIKKAGQEGLVRLLLETNLILADVEIQSGKKSDAASLLQSIIQEAKEHSLINIADRAGDLKQKTL
jgi:eukaryotic-like serine/threonine-protein kinase